MMWRKTDKQFGPLHTCHLNCYFEQRWINLLTERKEMCVQFIDHMVRPYRHIYLYPRNTTQLWFAVAVMVMVVAVVVVFRFNTLYNEFSISISLFLFCFVLKKMPNTNANKFPLFSWHLICFFFFVCFQHCEWCALPIPMWVADELRELFN